MSTLAVIAYPDQSTAGEAAAALVQMQKEFLIKLEDVAWVTKAQDGKMKLHQGANLTGAGAAGGAMWGFLFGLIFLVPIAGMALGAATGPSPASSAISASTTPGSRRWPARSNRADRGCS